MVNYKITKTQKLNNNYYKIFGKMYNADKTYYKNFKYITQNKNDYDCLNLINSFDDCTQFYDFCRQSIKDYNKTFEHNNNDFEIEGIKTKLIKEGYCGLKYFLVTGTIINYKLNKLKRFKFVINYDDDDICNYLEKENYNNKEEKEYKDFLISSMFNFINNFNDTKTFAMMCNDSIENYNNTLR